MIIAVLLLLTLGIAVIYSSSPSLAIQQGIFALVGMGLYFILKSFDYRSLTSFIKLAYFITILLLVVTLILGYESRGSVRWIPLGFFNLQPSEIAKVVLMLALADFWRKNLPGWKNILKSFLILLPMAALIFRQPDLGTALTVSFIWLSMLIASHISFKKISLMAIVLTLVTPVIWLLLRDYQKQRIYSFISPTSDPQGIGFHVIQSMIAVGSGGIFGRGLGRGTQSRLQFLPEFRTDFIFAFIAEELGLVGSMLVIGLYSYIFYCLYKVMTQSSERFGELIIIGVVGMLFFQIVVNIGMNIGVLPITGITLPLLSYGGSSLITTLICFGIIASIQKYGTRKKDIESFGTL